MPGSDGDIYKRYFELMPVLMGAVGYDGRIVRLNPASELQLGFKPAELAGKTYLDLVHPDELSLVRETIEKVRAGEPHARFDARFRCRDGSYKWLTTRCAADRVNSLLDIAAADITSRRLTEEALIGAERALRQQLDQAPVPMGILTVDGKIEHLNAKFVRTFGYTHNELPDFDTWTRLAAPDEETRKAQDALWARATREAAESGGDTGPIEFRARCKDGALKTVQVKAALAGTRFTIVFEDITERAAVLGALRDSEATLRKIIDNAPMAMAIVNLDGTIEYINHKAVEIFGYQHSDIPDMDRWWLLAYPDEAYRKDVVETWMGRVYKAFEDKTEIPGSEFLVTCKDGTRKTCFIFGVIAAGKVFVMFDDVTLRVKVQNALRESAANLRRVLELAPVAIGVRDLETGDLDFVNEAFTATYGYTRDDIRTFGDWMHKALPAGPHAAEWKEDWKLLVSAIKANGGAFPPAEYELTCRDGSVKTALLRGVLTPDDKILGIFEDVTVRAQTLRNLRESEATLRRLLEQAPICIAIHDLGGRVEFANRKFSQLFGYTAEDTPTVDDWARKVYPDEAYRSEVMSAWREQTLKSARTGREMEGLSARIRCKDGSLKTAFASGVVTADGKVIAVFDDITARTEAERALRESESLYRSLIETTGTGYVVLDGQGRVVDANREYVRLTGHADLKDILGRGVKEWVAPASQARAREASALVQRDGRIVGYELEYIRKTGGTVTVEINATIFERNGVQQILGLIRDVSARSKTEAHLRESESLYRALVETTRTGYVVIDMLGNVLDANKEYVRLTGHSELKEILGRCVTEWTAPDLMENNAAAVARCARDGFIFDYETDYIDAKGRRTPIEINATVVRRAGLPQIHTLCRDITERRRQGAELKALNLGLEKRVAERTADLSAANLELTMEIAQRIDAERAREKLQQELLQSQKMEVVGRLAGGIAHDFNNILVAISGYAEFLLKNASDGSPASEDLNEILRETERGALLTRQLVTISRRQPLQLKVLSINAIVEDTCRMLKRLVGANVHLEPSLAPDLAPIKADPGQVAQVILNLVINARDAMPDGGRITLTTANEEVQAVPAGLPLPPAPGGYAVLTVTDTGTGIAPEIAGKIFEPFFTTKSEGKGTGLGLSTVYGIVQQAQGGLLLTSGPGGASFKLYFPRTAEKA